MQGSRWRQQWGARLGLLAALVALAPSAAAAAASAAAAPGGAPALEAELLREAHAALDWIVDIRRRLHQIPELAFEEFKTSAAIRGVLDELGVEYDHPVARTGIVARIGPPPHSVALRADIDALPIEEEGTAPWRSTHPGRMHACGHDAHAAMLLGAARLLKARERELRRGVALVFQPAEEGRGGAGEVVASGALEGARAIFGLHVWPGPGAQAGTIATRPGPMMAASTRFAVTVAGRGGHAALPHLAADPVVAAAAVVTALQPLVSRETSPVGAAVVSVTRFNTGPGAANVIPAAVELQGTVRALEGATFARLLRRVEEAANATAAAAGCAAVGWSWSPRPYPPLVNDAALAALAGGVAARLAQADGAAGGGGGGKESGAGSGGGAAARVRFEPLEAPTMAAEDFSLYSAEGGIPGAFLFLAMDGGSAQAGLHSPGFDAVDRSEALLAVGAALHAALALEAHARQDGGGGGGGIGADSGGGGIGAGSSGSGGGGSSGGGGDRVEL
ncbi:IAA-amino acid hydrolase-like [Raphidocelis subcapitata]|uniref:IAA-amino acid hydrolase-like n=1 Tax=Raphidocelis subcapitata TaxID=307507 RepID=A0A2V0PIG5_9CHLO|nr:IAA-amino acid hydrolase-like [Raphidocelis subcapitata]|eukprot:GBF99601.1 IAA-amino acid hydrolase-like [Raphidocelis subcapitata]